MNTTVPDYPSRTENENDMKMGYRASLLFGHARESARFCRPEMCSCHSQSWGFCTRKGRPITKKIARRVCVWVSGKTTLQGFAKWQGKKCISTIHCLTLTLTTAIMRWKKLFLKITCAKFAHPFCVPLAPDAQQTRKLLRCRQKGRRIVRPSPFRILLASEMGMLMLDE